MPFELTDEPATFQLALDTVLSRFKWKTCLVYIDDIIIYWKSVDEHIRHVDEILTTLKVAEITLKMKKCNFFSDKVEYLGHLIRLGRLEVDTVNTTSLVTWNLQRRELNYGRSLDYGTSIDDSSEL